MIAEIPFDKSHPQHIVACRERDKITVGLCQGGTSEYSYSPDVPNDVGMLAISVPVRGRSDRGREHVNRFTANDMIGILSKYAEWVHTAPRSWSTKRPGELSTAYFYVTK